MTPALLANIRLGYKAFQGLRNVAYSPGVLVRKKKNFKTLTWVDDN